jgi:hypothetical protein
LHHRADQTGPFVRRQLIVSGDDLNHLIDPVGLILRVATTFMDLNACLSDDCFDILHLLVRKHFSVGELDGSGFACSRSALARHDIEKTIDDEAAMRALFVPKLELLPDF